MVKYRGLMETFYSAVKSMGFFMTLTDSKFIKATFLGEYQFKKFGKKTSGVGMGN